MEVDRVPPRRYSFSGGGGDPPLPPASPPLMQTEDTDDNNAAESRTAASWEVISDSGGLLTHSPALDGKRKFWSARRGGRTTLADYPVARSTRAQTGARRQTQDARLRDSLV